MQMTKTLDGGNGPIVARYPENPSVITQNSQGETERPLEQKGQVRFVENIEPESISARPEIVNDFKDTQPAEVVSRDPPS